MIRQIGVFLVAVILVATLLGYLLERGLSARDRAAFPAPGRHVQVDGLTMHLDCRGTGAPTVLLESGLMSGSSSWIFVHDRIATQTRTCAYDRAGMDWSAFGDYDASTSAVVTRLDALLDAAGERGPWIMVGMSAGGVYVREFQARFSQSVVGMVLVDSSHEQQASRLPTSGGIERLDHLLAICTALQPLGLIRLTDALSGFMNWYQLPASRQELFRANYYQTHSCRAIARESSAFGADLSRNLTPRVLGQLPLIVLSQGNEPRADPNTGETDDDARQQRAVWDELQSELTALSTRGERRVAHRSGHIIQMEEPEMVIKAIQDMLAITTTDRGNAYTSRSIVGDTPTGIPANDPSIDTADGVAENVAPADAAPDATVPDATIPEARVPDATMTDARTPGEVVGTTGFEPVTSTMSR